MIENQRFDSGYWGLMFLSGVILFSCIGGFLCVCDIITSDNLFQIGPIQFIIFTVGIFGIIIGIIFTVIFMTIEEMEEKHSKNTGDFEIIAVY